MISIKGRHHQRDFILQCVRWYVAYSLSYRDLEKIMQDHRFIKRKIKQAMGFETFSSATKTIAGLELWRMLKKGQKKWGGSKSPCALFYASAT